MKSAEEAINRVPGWHARKVAVIEELDGLTNRSYRVRVDGSDYALRLDGPLARAYGLDRDRELAILQSAASAGLAPEVVYAGEGVLVTRWVDGGSWVAGTLDTKHLESIASLLRKVHALPLCGHPLDAPRAADRYLEHIRPAFLDKAREHAAIIESIPQPLELRLCHNDVVAANIVGASPAVLIDWEYACDNDPMFDLACLIEYHQLNDQKAAVLLSAYAGGAASDLSERLSDQRRLYAALQFLWFAARDGGIGQS